LWFVPAFVLLAPALGGSAADRDLYGDPLPDGAKARLGTTRLRVETRSPPLMTADGKSIYATTSFWVQRLDPVTGLVQGKAQQAPSGQLVGISANGTRAAFMTSGGVTVWDLTKEKDVVKILRRLPGSETAAALAGNGKTLVLGGVNEIGKQDPITVLVWDVDADKELTKVTDPHNQWVSVAVSGDGKTFASWGSHLDPNAKGSDPETNLSRVVRFWDAASGKELGTFRTSGYAPAAVAFTHNGSVGAVANGDGTIDLVDPKTGTSKNLLLGCSRMGQWLAFSPDGATVAATSDDGLVRRWKVADGTRLSTTEAPISHPSNTRVQLVSNDKGLAWATKGKAIVVWEVPTGKLLGPAGGHTSGVRSVAVTPDNKFVVTSADDGTVLKWELATGKPVGAVVLRQPGGAFPSPALCSPDGSRALVRDGSGLAVYDTATGAQQFILPLPLNGYNNGTFGSDGTKVIVATSSYNAKQAPGRVTVWDVVAGKRLVSVELPGTGSIAAALTPDGKYLVTVGNKPAEKGAGEFVATVWEVATGARKGEFTEPGGFSAPFVATAADNKTAAVVTTKGQLAAFTLATSKLEKTFTLKLPTGRGPAIPPVFSPDGKKLAVAGEGGFDDDRTATVLVLDWATGDTKYTFRVKGGTPVAMAFSHDGKWLVTGSPDTTATVWDVSK
jgi:WD40 repeat protein